MAEGWENVHGCVIREWKSGTFNFNTNDTPMDISITVPKGSYAVSLICNVQSTSNTGTYPRMYLTVGGVKQDQYAAIMISPSTTQSQLVLVKFITVSSDTVLSGSLSGDGNCQLFEGRQIEAIKVA